MQNLNYLNNVQRAKLLFDLFSTETVAFLAFADKVAQAAIEQKDQLSENWEMPILSVHQWIELAHEVRVILERYKTKLPRSSRLLADQLFDGYTALFTVHCLQQYCATQSLYDFRFKTAVALFF